MESKSTIEIPSYSTPPPTSNLLNKCQRRRLVRSARKLEAVLGTAPLVAEEDVQYVIATPLSAKEPCSSASSSRSSTPFSDLKRSRRQASICSLPDSPELIYTSDSFTSSVIELALPTGRASAEMPPLKKKCSMKFKSSFKSRSAIENLRPLMLRLEPLPTTVDTQSPSSATPSTPSTPTPSTPSLLTPGTPTPTGTPVLTPTTPNFPTPAEIRRKRMAKLTRTLGEIIPPHLVYTSKGSPISPVSASSFLSSESEKPSVRPINRTRRSLSVDLGSENVPPFSTESQTWVVGHDTWRGEWNRKDIREVQRQLRTLRAR